MIDHNGFTLCCDVPRCDGTFTSHAHTRRTAIDHARLAHWFVGRVRITRGARPSDIRTVERTLCPCCKHLLGL